MPKPKWNLNTIYISERLQESLRPISRCAMTTVVAPMGYGKTTAVNWYLEERAKAETLKIIRISVYSDNLAIFWKSVQEAFARAGFPFLREYPCPTDAAGGGLMVDDLCHELAGETSCYIFIDDFHLLTDRRASAEENEEYSKNLSYPVYIVTYTAGENEDTREWTVFVMDTDICTYLYGFCVPPDAAADMDETYQNIFSQLYLSDEE